MPLAITRSTGPAPPSPPKRPAPLNPAAFASRTIAASKRHLAHSVLLTVAMATVSAVAGLRCAPEVEQHDAPSAPAPVTSAAVTGTTAPLGLDGMIQHVRPYMRDFTPKNQYAAREVSDVASDRFLEWAKEGLEADDVRSGPPCPVPADRRAYGSICCVQGKVAVIWKNEGVTVTIDHHSVYSYVAKGADGYIEGADIRVCGVVTGRFLGAPGPTPILTGLVVERP